MSVADWTNIHPKVFTGAIVAVIVWVLAPFLASHGVALDPAVMGFLTSYLTPEGK